MLKLAHLFLIAIVSCFNLGCGAQAKYDATATGRVGGKYELVWTGPERFAFLPDRDDPFYFQRSDGTRITPGPMYTDGGSIPRPLWAVRNYSPWTYGPAFIIHDWLFVAHSCGYPEYEKYTMEESAAIMAECMKTLMEEGKAPKSVATLDLMHRAVNSRFASRVWNQPPVCVIPDTFALEHLLGADLAQLASAEMPPTPTRSRDIPPELGPWVIRVDLNNPRGR